MQNASSEIRTEPRGTCILCGSKGEVLYRNVPDAFLEAPGVWNLRKCQESRCGLIWLDPAPVKEDLHLAYASYFTHGELDGKRNALGALRAKLYEVYKFVNSIFAKLFGLQKQQERANRIYLEDIRPGKLLDVGCGDGTLLHHMRQFGWAVEGIDFDAKAIANAKTLYGLDLHVGDLHSKHFPDESFDAITLKHVIEHIPDPVGLLREVARILKAGGRAVVTTPNSSSFGHEKFKQYWFGLDPPRHLQVFSLSSLTECARLAGFNASDTFTTAANADIFIGGSYSTQEAVAYNQKNEGRTRINVGRALKAMFWQYREASSMRGNPILGEEAVLICRKQI